MRITCNWSEYDAGLRRREILTVWHLPVPVVISDIITTLFEAERRLKLPRTELNDFASSAGVSNSKSSASATQFWQVTNGDKILFVNQCSKGNSYMGDREFLPLRFRLGKKSESVELSEKVLDDPRWS